MVGYPIGDVNLDRRYRRKFSQMNTEKSVYLTIISSD